MNHSVCLTVRQRICKGRLQRKTEAFLYALIAQRRMQSCQLSMSAWDPDWFCSEAEICLPGWSVAHVLDVSGKNKGDSCPAYSAVLWTCWGVEVNSNSPTQHKLFIFTLSLPSKNVRPRKQQHHRQQGISFHCNYLWLFWRVWTEYWYLISFTLDLSNVLRLLSPTKGDFWTLHG